MEACIYKKFGKESVLEWVDGWPKPECKSDSVIVEVAAISINPKDALLRKGKFSRTLARDPLPRVTGLDISGIVVEVGNNVTRIKVGDTIFGMTNNFSGGVLSSFAALKETEVTKAPISISLVEINKKNRLVFVHSSYQDLNQLANWINNGELFSHIQKIYKKK